MALESSYPALSPAVVSFVIAGKTWKIGDTINSTGAGAVEKKKMVENFGARFATTRVEGVFMGRGSGHKYRAKWINLSEEHVCDYGANHGLLQEPYKKRPLKVPKIHGLQ